MLALKRRGRYGLLFLDGHCDFYSPESEPNGEVASMELAMVTGREPQLLGDLVGSPLVREDDVVAFGVRDTDAAARNGSPDIRETSIRVLECSVVQQRGVARAAREAVASLEARGLDGFWLHLDADVLNDAVMPAVDYRMPGGLGPDELAATLQAAFRSEKVIGMDITIYNPLLDDATFSAGRVLAGAIASALTAANDFNGPSPAP